MTRMEAERIAMFLRQRARKGLDCFVKRIDDNTFKVYGYSNGKEWELNQ